MDSRGGSSNKAKRAAKWESQWESAPMKSPPSSPRLHGAKMGPPPSPSRLKTLTENFHSLTGSNVHMVFAAAVSNNPEQIDVLSQLNPSEYTWEKLKEIKHSFAPVTLNHATTPEGVAALLDNLEFVQYWVGRCLVEDGVVPGTVWTHACMGPSIRTIEWLLENHGGTILVGLKTQDMEGAVDQVVPPTPLNEVLRQKKLLARAICYVLDSIDHAPKIYTMKGRDERASRAEKVIEMIRDHCYDLNRGLRVSGAAHGPKHVFSKTPLRHAALYGSIGCFDLILKSTNVVNPQSLFEALFPHFERNSFRDNNFRFSMAFLRFLTKVVPEGERRSMVNRYLSKAKVYFKDANFFRYLMVNDYLPRDGNLVSYLLSLAPHITFKASYYRPILRRQMLRSLSFVCGQNGGCSANDLALLIDMVKTPNTPLHNARGLVRMAIFCGADPHVPVVRLTVDPPPPLPPQTPPNTPIILPPMHRWPGFDEDIKSARYWTRWMSENSVGGLPPELTREIFLWHLESLL